jgi:LmbE family N-acetylglucosaminyl deacetylase
MRRAFISLFLVFVAGNVAFAQLLPAFTKQDRIIIVAPHPDDEILGCGGVIQQALAAGADVHVIYLTNGDHNLVAFKLYNRSLILRARQYLQFGERRRQEAIAATSRLGLPADHLTFLGYPDWGTLTIWRIGWSVEQPFRSGTTRASEVPYKEAFGYRKPYKPESVVGDFVKLFRQFKPTCIFVSHPADINPDHRAASNFVRLALLELADEGVRPETFYYVVHFGGWPRPYHYHPELGLDPPRALLDDGEWFRLPLAPQQVEAKYEATLTNRTQLTTRQYFLVALARANELFAKIPIQRVPEIPRDAPLDWRRAVRSKAIDFAPADSLEQMTLPDGASRPPDEQTVAQTEKLELRETRLLRQGDDLIALVEFRNRLGRRANFRLLLFGYQRGVDFARLPKVEIHMSPLGKTTVFVNGRRQMADVQVTGVANRLFVRVPMQLLGGDKLNHLFTATRSMLREITPDDTAWMLFSLQRDAESENG